MAKPFFSIIIPTYNRAEFFGKTIDSLLNQNFQDFEIIVVDDGSTDNTKEIVSTFTDQRVKYYKKENGERGAARNYGAKIAQGKYLNFFDSDDIAYPNHLQEAFKLIEDYKNPKVFALGYDITNEKREIIRKREQFKDINKQLIHGNLLSCNGVFILRETALQHPFSEIRELSASEDYLLWLQLASKFKIYFRNTSTSAIIEHDNRSVLEINPEKLIRRKELMLQMALQDQYIVNYYGNKIKYLKANTYSYIALHLALSQSNKNILISYYLKSLKITPSFLFRKRNLIILYNYFFHKKLS